MNDRTLIGQLRSLPAAYWRACAMQLFWWTSYHIANGVLVFRVPDSWDTGGWGAGPVAVGIVTLAWYGASAAVSFVAAPLLDARGYRRAIVWGSAFGVLGFVAMAAARPAVGSLDPDLARVVGFTAYVAAVLLARAGSGLIVPAILGTVAREAPAAAMTLGWGIFAWLPPLVAAAVRVLVGELGWSTILLCAGLPLVACGGIALCGREEHHRAAAGGLRTAFRAAAEIVKCGPYVVPVACVGVVASIVSIAAIRGIHHIMWWCDTSGPAALLSVVFSLAEHSSGRAMDVAVRLRFISWVGPVLLLSVPLAYWASKVARLKAVLVGAALGVIGVALIGTTRIAAVVAGAMLLCSVSRLVWQPALRSHLVQLAPPARRGTYVTYSSLFEGAGGVWLAGWLMRLVESFAPTGVDVVEGSVVEGALTGKEPLSAPTRAELMDLLWEQQHPWLFWFVFAAVAFVFFFGLLLYVRLGGTRGRGRRG